ncbi:Protein ABCI7, chloroplastic [Apostasia shenzhenica]|uniref:Protein ABCI7, chloroplastic n=1 Tax=Apostasia shenzhenica TaxID=1088818 RepID=A0A2I0AJW4_9ASPA|nr:Protein ABCI7, chloroplastic [Apostasia shenzhenica]
MACSCSSASFSPLRLLRSRPLLKRRLRFHQKTIATATNFTSASLSDPFVLDIADKLEDSLSLCSTSCPSVLLKLRDSSSQSLLTQRWPSAKEEPFRFTDLSFLKSSEILPAASTSAIHPAPSFSFPASNFLTIVDGCVVPSLSRLTSLPAGAFAGSAVDVPSGHLYETVFAAAGEGFSDGDLFWNVNGFGAPDLAVVYIPEGERLVDDPLHLRFCAAEATEAGSGRLLLSNPRVLVVVGKGSELSIVEEHLGVEGSGGACYWSNSVVEIVVEEGAKVSHTYIQKQSMSAAHTKWTFVRQGKCSSYELIELSTGAKLSRHSLHVQQLGPDTTTELSAFHVSRNDQIQDLHSRLILDHPRGYSRQLHKCIVSHSSGHAIFDGNIKVNRFAQQTDAGQLTRTLLLAPRATANVKPNLQIIADDVKCSHGAAISDLEEDQLFYFQARGVDQQTARDALTFSFGAEVLARIPFEPYRKSVSNQVKQLLTAG